MLKKRIGAAIVVKDNWVVQSIGFKKYLPVGKAEIAVEYLNRWGIDEIILLDISATKNHSVVSSSMVSKAAKYSRVPLAIGGGISNVHQMEDLLQNGADKICLNNVLFNDISLLTKGARQFGDQCMVAVIDFVKDPASNQYKVYDYITGKMRDLNVIEYSKHLEESGAGELLLQSVDRDGKYNGFEKDLYNEVCKNVHIPVIALGGAGNATHFDELFDKSDVSAACAGNIFHFSEHSVNVLKAQLLREQHNIRLETHANYEQNKFDEKDRLLKADDRYLEDLLFIRIEKEVI